jgi:hypothetical protein
MTNSFLYLHLSSPQYRLLSSEGDMDYFLSPKGITKDSWKR